MGINQHSFYLKSGDEHLACTVLMPDRISGAILMLPPFVEERKGSLPFMLSVARKLYPEGIATLIFDWRGSGDSSGEFKKINPDDFTTDFRNVLAWLIDHTSRVPITLMGLRLSATFLIQLKTNHPEINCMVLISPVYGDEFMRQLLQRRMVNDMVAYGKATENRTTLLEKLKRGSSIDLDGYIFTKRMYEWVLKRSEVRHQESGVSPPTSLATGHLPLATLIIPGGHSNKTAVDIADELENIETSELRFPPFWNTVGHVNLSELINTASNWIKTNSAARTEPRPPIICAKKDEKREDEAPDEPLFIPNMQLADIPASDSTIRAVVNLPEKNPKAGILFLPGWSGDRTGPHRIFVQLADKLAGEGYFCLRPDFRGRGLSDGQHEDTSIASMAEDAGSALAELYNRLPENTPVYVIAICSGCKVAITLASKHAGIEKMLLLSAESMGSLRNRNTNTQKTRKALKTYLKKLTQPETWKKILTGKVQTKMVTKALVQHETRSDDEAKAEDSILKNFEQFSNPVHFIFGGSDPDAPGSMEAYKTYCEANNIPHTMHLIPNAGHSYYSTEWTEEVFESGIGFLK